MVFPEDGIIDPTPYTRLQLKHIAEQLPDPSIDHKYIACDDPNAGERKPITYRLSCLAKRNRIYIVADYGERRKCNITSDLKCPEDGHYLFNTAVAFGPDGSLVAKYHKMHLCQEPTYDSPPQPELVFFDTDFGRIGLFICFDIVFRQPGIDLVENYGIKTMAFPTWWFDGLPFITAEQIQEGWAFTNQVNLLAANTHLLSLGSTGSGIYSGQSGPMVASEVMAKSDNLLIADIPIDSRNLSAKCLTNRYNKTVVNNRSNDPSNYNIVFNIDGSSLLALEKDSDSVRVCNNGLCCRLEYSIDTDEREFKAKNYRLIAVNRAPKACGKRINEEICGVFRCDDQNCRSIAMNSNQVFRRLELSARFSTKYSYPMITTNRLKLVDKKFWTLRREQSDVNHSRLALDRFEEPLLSMALYGRNYEWDPV